LQKISIFFLPKVKLNSKFSFEILGRNNGHYFVGYYDIDPYRESEGDILCHYVSPEYSQENEPSRAEIGLLSLTSGNFLPIVTTKAVNWQLGSRVQWVSEKSIIYNDVVENDQCSIIFDVEMGKIVKKFARPFWAISPNKEIAASLNFSRIKKRRPGYGYKGKSIDGDEEILTLFSLKTDEVLFQISLDKIINQIGYAVLPGTDPYMNHIAWSPCATKFITIFHFEESKSSSRKIFPVIIDLKDFKCILMHSSGYFSHHVWLDEDRMLAYIELNGKKCFSIWSEKRGWVEVSGSMPLTDGHPTPILNSDKIIVDSYPNRFGRMSLYIGSSKSDTSLFKVGEVMSPPSYKGPLRCDLHPRVSKNNSLIICDFPDIEGRRLLVIEGNLDKNSIV